MRPHRLPDRESESPLAADASQQALALLLTIRRQRLRRSEHLLRERESALREAESQHVSAQTALENGQQAYRQLRDAFVTRHQKGVQKQERLMQGLQQERDASHAVAAQHSQLARCRLQTADKERLHHHARQETQARLRDVEKLAWMIQQSEAR